MKALVFVELDEGKPKKSSLEAVSYGAEIAESTVALVLGQAEHAEFEVIGQAGAEKVIHVKDARLNQPNISAYSQVIGAVFEQTESDIFIFSKK